jgi:hypothetical protein
LKFRSWRNLRLRAKTAFSCFPTLAYCGQSPAFLERNVTGKKTWFRKSALVTYIVDDESKTVCVTMTTAYAKKRGFI